MLNKFPFEDGDRIVLIKSYKSHDETLSKARDLIRGLGEIDISYKIIHIRDDEILEGISDLYREIKSSNIILWILDSTPPLTTILILFGILNPNVRSIYIYNLVKEDIVKVPKFGLKLPKLNKNEKIILDTLLKHGEMSLNEIATYTNLSYTQVYRAVGNLRNKNYAIYGKGRGRRISLSELGILRSYLDKILGI